MPKNNDFDRREDIMQANLLHGKILKGLQKISTIGMGIEQRNNLKDILTNLDGLIIAARAYLSKMHEYRLKCEVLTAICEEYTKVEDTHE